MAAAGAGHLVAARFERLDAERDAAAKALDAAAADACRARSDEELLRSTNAALTWDLDLPTVCEQLLDYAEWLAPYGRAELYWVEGARCEPACLPRDRERMDGEPETLPSGFDWRDSTGFEAVIRGQRILVVEDAAALPGRRPGDGLPAGGSWLGIPVVARGRVEAVCSLADREPGRYRQDQARSLEALAFQAAFAMTNARAYEEAREARKAADALLAVGQTVSSTLELDEVLDRILHALGQVLPFDSASISLYENGWLSIRAAGGFDDAAALVGYRFPLERFPLDREILETGRPIVLSDTRADPRWQEELKPIGDPVRGWMGIPLLAAGEAIGLLCIDSHRPGTYSEAQLPIATAIASQLGLAVHNARLFEAAQSASRAKSAFLASMSHELRTPLNAILGFSQILERDARLAGDQLESVGIIERSGEHLLTLINDVLDLAKVEAGRMAAEPREFDPGRALDDVVDMFRVRVEKKGLYLRLEKDPDLPRSIVADERKIRQVAINLLGNAVKFTEKGGLTVRISTPPDGLGTRLRLRVEDTGPGIDPGEMAALFEPFVQATAGLRSREGTGLGLPLSRQFARVMGGDLVVESLPGRGSAFTLDIPIGPGTGCSEDGEAAEEGRIDTSVRDLAAAEPGWAAAFREALVEGDVAEIEALVASIRDAHPEAAAALGRAVRGFDYDLILASMDAEEEEP